MLQLTESFFRDRSSQIIEKKFAESSIFSSHQEENSIPVFAPNEVEFGRNLAGTENNNSSSLYSVLLLENINLDQKEEEKNNESAHHMIKAQGRKIINNSTTIEDGKFRYVIKKMTPDIFNKCHRLEFVVAVVDLATEAKILSVIQHPHIIKIRALADVDYCSKDFFILLDRLNFTLTEQVYLWKRQQISVYRASNVNKPKMNNQLFCERLSVCHDICSALDYLHKKRIVYRYLKPGSIGFDLMGDVKLCDFSVATEMGQERRVKGTNTYLLTKNTGSPRYMAPEVFRGDPYNQKCDVYSFGLILWQCSELNIPFERFSKKDIISHVYSGKMALSFNPDWSEQLRNLFSSCWSSEFQRRYDCDMIMEILKTEIEVISSK